MASDSILLDADEKGIGAIAKAVRRSEWMLEQQPVRANGDAQGHALKERSPSANARASSGNSAFYFTR